MPYALGADFDRCANLFPAPAPYGEDVKYDAVYLDLRAEVQKLTAVSSLDGGIDWKSIRAWGISILGEKSKDLTVASYLTLALFQLDGYGGLADGIALLTKMMRDDWDGMFPPSARPRTRAVALEWLISRLAPFVEERAPTAEEAAVFAEIRTQLPALQEIVRQKLMHEAPGFGDLSAALSGHEAAVPAPSAGGEAAAAASGPPAQAPSTPTGAPAPQTAPPPPAAIAAGTPAGGIAEQIRPLVTALRQADPLSPLPYRLLRALKWETVQALPPAEAGITRIPPPRREQKESLERLHAAGAWADLLTTAEGLFQDGVGTFWLDLQRYAAVALEGLDPVQGKRAAQAIGRETAGLLARLPDLPTLHFADRNHPAPAGKPNEKTVERTPFASEATQQWIENEVLAKDEPASADLPFLVTTASPTGPALAPEDARKAQELLAKGQLTAGLALLQTAVRQAPGERDRFRARLAAARVCLQANQAGWARGLLEDLQVESESFRFEEWDPETALELYQLLAITTARPAKKGGPADPEAARVKLEELRKKVLRLDLAAAAALEEALRR